jgi:hypothetical protein
MAHLEAIETQIVLLQAQLSELRVALNAEVPVATMSEGCQGYARETCGKVNPDARLAGGGFGRQWFCRGCERTFDTEA